MIMVLDDPQVQLLPLPKAAWATTTSSVATEISVV